MSPCANAYNNGLTMLPVHLPARKCAAQDDELRVIPWISTLPSRKRCIVIIVDAP